MNMKQYRLEPKSAPQIFTEKYTAHALAAATAANCCARTDAGRLYVGTDKGVLLYENARFTRLSGIDGEVTALCPLPDGRIAAAAGEEIYAISGETLSPLQTLNGPVRELGRAGENAYALTPGTLYKFDGALFQWEQDIDFDSAVCMAPTPGKTVYVSTPQAMLRLMAKRTRFGMMRPNMTRTPQMRVNRMAADAFDTVWCGAENGVWVFDGKSEWIPPEALTGFPQCNITAVALGKKNIYVGTEAGLYIVSGEHTRFYGAGRYLTGARVRAVLPNDAEDEIVVCADGGVSILRFKQMTLAEKDAYFESIGPLFNRENYYTDRCGLVNGDLASGCPGITDNDGLYTSDFVAYQSMKYAVTGDETAREKARASMQALLKLQRVTGITGFPARAYRRPGEDRFGDGDIEWHLTSDETGPLEWKGETSSDELVGHYFAGCWYFDLCATAEEKAELAEAYRAITDHILSHGYTLCDADGAPTSWAHFGPEELNHDDAWCWEKGVNSLELLSFLRITHHMTGDETYLNEQKRLLMNSHYAMNLLAYKKDDAHSSVIDDRLTMYIVTHLLRLETDETLLRYVRLGLRRHYEYIKDNHMPYFSFVFALANGGHTDLDEAVRVLEEYPIDPRYYKMTNLGRPDVTLDERVAEFAESDHLKHPIPASERVPGTLHSAARELSCHTDNRAQSPCSWQVAYWFGRYLGVI